MSNIKLQAETEAGFPTDNPFCPSCAGKPMAEIISGTVCVRLLEFSGRRRR